VVAIYSSLFRPNSPTIGDLALCLFFAGGALLFFPRVLMTSAGGTLHVDREGIHLVRAFNRKVDIPWDNVDLVRHGPRRIRSMKVSSLGYALVVRGKLRGQDQLIEVDDVNYLVSQKALRNVIDLIVARAARGTVVESPPSSDW